MKLLLSRLASLAVLMLGCSLASVSVVVAQEDPIPRPTGMLDVLSGPGACDDQRPSRDLVPFGSWQSRTPSVASLGQLR